VTAGVFYAIDTGVGWVKIGQTRFFKQRTKEHAREWPRLNILAAVDCHDCKQTESDVFLYLNILGVTRNGRRELFSPDHKILRAITLALFTATVWDIDVYRHQNKQLEKLRSFLPNGGK